MKSKVTLLLVLSLLCALLIGCAAQQNVKLAYIGADEAKALALGDAGLDAQSASGFSTDMGTRDGLDYYSVSFTANGQSYSYDVDALTGNILARGGAAGAAQNAPAAEAQLNPTAKAASAQLAPAAATATAGEIDAEQAKSIALAHAGLSAADVTFIRAEPDFDDGRRVYEIEFYGKDYTEYDYDVDMANGEILSFDRDAEYYDGKAAAASAPAASGTEGLIGEDEAKRIALEHAGLAENDVKFVRSQLEYDDGRREYELEFYTAEGMEYDYDIDAQSGRILSHDRDAEYYRPSGSQSGAQSGVTQSGSGSSSGASISEAEARRIALAQVPGADESHIRKFKIDRDDGRLEYDGEIVYNNMEYEFEIDAYSGAIRDWDVESVFGD